MRGVMAFVVLIGFASVSVASIDAQLNSCVQDVRRDPRSRLAWSCFWESPTDQAQRTLALQRIELLLGSATQAPWGEYARALLLIRNNDPSAVDVLQSTIERFDENTDDEWQIWTRALLAGQLTNRSRFEEAHTLVERMRQIAERTLNSDFLIRTLDRAGWNSLRQGDYSSAQQAFRQARSLLASDAAKDQRIRIESALGGVAWALQQDQQALAHYQAVLALDPRNLAARANALALADQLRLAGRGDPVEIRALAEQALDPTRGEVSPLIALRAHLLLGRLSDGEAALIHLEHVLAAAARTADPAELRSAWRTVGLRLVELGPTSHQRGLALLEQARAASDQSGGAEDRVRSLDMYCSALSLVGPPERAIEMMERRLDAVEALRTRQANEEVRGTTLAGYARFYAHLAGYLLDHADGVRASLDRAFEVQERLRARLLLDALQGSAPTAAPPEFPSITEIQQALRPGQALISFHLAPQQLSGSWQLVIWRDGVQAFQLPPSDRIERDVTLFLGLLEANDQTSHHWAQSLGDALLGTAQRALPAAIDSLILVPDGVLWHLPFGALRFPDSATPVGLRWSVSLAPSGATWLKAKGASAYPLPAAVLSLADPPVDLTALNSSMRNAARNEPELGRLPRARDEALHLVDRFGGASRLWIGAQAREQVLQHVDFTKFGLIHLAAHAVVDEQQPERNAVILAPSRGSDGHLTTAEIARLNVADAVVVLSACRSTQGRILAGEGPLSLSRAFLAAGASGVVGTLWPIRDEHAQRLISQLGERLADGIAVAEALSLTQRSLHDDGYPPAVWAGLVLIGDGDARLMRVPARTNPAGTGWWILVYGLIALVLTGKLRSA